MPMPKYQPADIYVCRWDERQTAVIVNESLIGVEYRPIRDGQRPGSAIWMDRDTFYAVYRPMVEVTNG